MAPATSFRPAPRWVPHIIPPGDPPNTRFVIPGQAPSEIPAQAVNVGAAYTASSTDTQLDLTEAGTEITLAQNPVTGGAPLVINVEAAGTLTAGLLAPPLSPSDPMVLTAGTIVFAVRGASGWAIAVTSASGGGGGGVSAVTAASPLASSGGDTPEISIEPGPDGNSIQTISGVVVWAPQAAGGVTAVTATAPLASSGGDTPVISVPGAGTNEFTDEGTIFSIPSTETIFGNETPEPIKSFTGSATTTDGVTWVTIAGPYAPPADSLTDWSVSLASLDVTTPSPLSGIFYRADLAFDALTTAGATTLIPGVPAALNPKGTGLYSIQAIAVGAEVLIQVRGAAAETVHWNVIGQVQPVA